MRRSAAAVGSAVFFVVAPGVVAGLSPGLSAGGSCLGRCRVRDHPDDNRCSTPDSRGCRAGPRFRRFVVRAEVRRRRSLQPSGW